MNGREQQTRHEANNLFLQKMQRNPSQFHQLNKYQPLQSAWLSLLTDTQSPPQDGSLEAETHSSFCLTLPLHALHTLARL